MFEFACQLGALAPLPPPIQQLLVALKDNQEASDAYLSALTGYVPFSRFMNPENIGRIMAQAAAAS